MPESWRIPAKTFLLGEYAALQEKSALLLTTTPCFELRACAESGLHGIHPQSPAGRWWAQCNMSQQGFIWQDPYQGLGGMGASSAQFIAVYQACAHLRQQAVDSEVLLQDYWQIVAPQAGMRPSGYDVIAQQLQGCVYVNRDKQQTEQYAWPFSDIGFILLHSGQKLATHEHLQQLVLTEVIHELSDLVNHAKQAFLSRSSYHLVEAVKAYHQVLSAQGWVASHTLDCIQRLYQDSPALAIKGCGALGSDVILVLLKQAHMANQLSQLSQNGWHILASTSSLYITPQNTQKTT